jgi:hypothetical protein
MLHWSSLAPVPRYCVSGSLLIIQPPGALRRCCSANQKHSKDKKTPKRQNNSCHLCNMQLCKGSNTASHQLPVARLGTSVGSLSWFWPLLPPRPAACQDPRMGSTGGGIWQAPGTSGIGFRSVRRNDHSSRLPLPAGAFLLAGLRRQVLLQWLPHRRLRPLLLQLMALLFPPLLFAPMPLVGQSG